MQTRFHRPDRYSGHGRDFREFEVVDETKHDDFAMIIGKVVEHDAQIVGVSDRRLACRNGFVGEFVAKAPEDAKRRRRRPRSAAR